MAQMAYLASYGGVPPDVYDGMDPLIANELTRRLIRMKQEEEEAFFKFFAEMFKAVIKSNGARVI